MTVWVLLRDSKPDSVWSTPEYAYSAKEGREHWGGEWKVVEYVVLNYDEGEVWG